MHVPLDNFNTLIDCATKYDLQISFYRISLSSCSENKIRLHTCSTRSGAHYNLCVCKTSTATIFLMMIESLEKLTHRTLPSL